MLSKSMTTGRQPFVEYLFNIEPGEFAYIVGPSGAGKSTFIRLLYREVKHDKGSLKVADFDLDKIKKRDIPMLRRNVGVVFQDYKLLPKEDRL